MSDIVEQTTVSADGVRLGYFRRGAGPALVIVHGSIATREQWMPATAHLARDFTCFVHDRRGRGSSGDSPNYGMTAEVNDIAAMLAVAGPGAHLLGHSYGALCALAHAERRPLDGTLVLFEPPLPVDGPIAGEGLAGFRALVEAGDLDAALAFALVRFVGLSAEAIAAIRQTPMWSASRPLTAGWVRELAEIDALGPDLHRYATIKARSRILAGLATTPALRNAAHRLARVIPGAAITDLPGAGHFAHVAAPARFAAAVRTAIV